MNKMIKKTINHEVTLVIQGLQECVQASASILLSHYGIHKTLSEIKQEVPVYISKNGDPIGTSIGHIASYFIKLGFKTTIHTTDIQIFDRSWENKNTSELIELLKLRKKYVKHSTYDNNTLDVIFDGYIYFLQKKGQVVFPEIDVNYIYEKLKKGPIFAVVNYNYFNNVAKYAYDAISKCNIEDSIKGNPGTHAVVIHGYNDCLFRIADPDQEFGGYKSVRGSHLIASHYLAQTDFDNIMITLER